MRKYLSPPHIIFNMSMAYYNNGNQELELYGELDDVIDAYEGLDYTQQDFCNALQQYADLYAGKNNGLYLGNYLFYFTCTLTDGTHGATNFNAINWEGTDTASERVANLAAILGVSDDEARQQIIDAFEFFAALYGPYDPNYVEPIPADHAGYNALKAKTAESEEAAFNADVANLAKSVSINNVQVIGEAEEEDSGEEPAGEEPADVEII